MGQFHVEFYFEEKYVSDRILAALFFVLYWTINCNALQPSFNREASQSYYKQEH